MEDDLQVLQQNDNNVSFLSLLMAPDNNTPEPDEDHYQHFINSLQTETPPPSYYYYDQINTYDHQIAPEINNNIHTTSFLSNPYHQPEYYNFIHPWDEFSTYLQNFNVTWNPNPSPSPNPNPNPQPSAVEDDYSLDSILENYLKYSITTSSKKKRKKKSKRSKLGDKVYNLGKLLPGAQMERKNMVEVLEEAHKYVKFLEAQVMALQSMPTESNEFGAGGNYGGVSGGAGGALMKLNRQQVLEVVVNSAAAQMVMAENGWCLVSAEQVEVMNRVHARNKIIQQVLDTIPF